MVNGELKNRERLRALKKRKLLKTCFDCFRVKSINHRSPNKWQLDGYLKRMLIEMCQFDSPKNQNSVIAQKHSPQTIGFRASASSLVKDNLLQIQRQNFDVAQSF